VPDEDELAELDRVAGDERVEELGEQRPVLRDVQAPVL
jgi:hypothetical protein